MLCLCTMCVTDVHRGQKRAMDSPGTGVIDNCKPPNWCRERNLGPLQEQQALLNAEPSLQPTLRLLLK